MVLTILAILFALVFGAFFGILSVGMFNKPMRDRRHYADTAYNAMVEYGINSSTAELIRQRIEELLSDD